jgi:hypothetical protein
VNAGELLVGLGTLALAGFTWRLASTTSASVAAARDSADAERASVDAMHMPFVIAVPTPADALIDKHAQEYADVKRADVPTQIHRVEDGSVLRLRLWNIGVGPAIVTGLRLHYQGDEFLDDSSPDVPIAANQPHDAEVDTMNWPIERHAATLTIDYIDATGKPYVTQSNAWIEGGLVACSTYQQWAPPWSPRADPTLGLP